MNITSPLDIEKKLRKAHGFLKSVQLSAHLLTPECAKLVEEAEIDLSEARNQLKEAGRLRLENPHINN